MRANGLDLSYLEWAGAGHPTLLFLHGGSAHAHWFDRVIPAFEDRHRILSLDQRGHGHSGWASPPAYGTEDFCDDIHAFLIALDVDRVVLVGHSMGGQNALGYAAWHPERVCGVVVADSPNSIPQSQLDSLLRRWSRGHKRHPSAERAVAAFGLQPRETVADPALLRHLGREGIVEKAGGWEYRFDPQANAARRPADCLLFGHLIRAPTLIVRGGLSSVLTADMAERMRVAIPNASLVELPGTYHHLVLDAPERFAALLQGFLERLPVSQAAAPG